MATLRRALGVRREKGGSPTSRKIEPGDLLLIDFSVIVVGLSRRFHQHVRRRRRADARPARAVRRVRRRLEGRRGRAQARHGRRDVDAAVRGHFAALGLDRYFPTHSGHGLGLGHPEPPYFVPESSDTLEVGDVVALEPGLYVEGTGGMRYRAELPDHRRRLRDALES